MIGTAKTRTLNGMFYREYIWELLRQRRAKNWFEVGVHNGSTMAGVSCPCIGVDPGYTPGPNPIGQKREMHLYQMTSDEYFRDHDPRAIFGGPVDVSFLDGLHQFEYLLRDFINTEAVSAASSLIMLDDCLPVNIEIAERVWNPGGRTIEETRGGWTGDVWKVVNILREYRPDLRIVAVDTTPSGNIGVVNLNPKSTVLRDRYFEIVEKYMKLDLRNEFDRYWQVNAPISAAEILVNNNLTRWFGA